MANKTLPAITLTDAQYARVVKIIPGTTAAEKVAAYETMVRDAHLLEGLGEYDLVVMGALGLGKVRDSQIGSVVERVSRSCNREGWPCQNSTISGRTR